MKNLALLISALALAGCTRQPTEPAWKKHSFKKHAVSNSSRVAPTQLPEALWNQIEAVYTQSAAASKPAGGGEKSEENGNAKSGVHVPVPTEFAPLKVYFIEKNRGIVGGQNQLLQFPPGGGEINLSEIVEPKNGTFSLAFEFMPEITTDKSPGSVRRVFFLSNSVKRKIGGEILGNGCHTYFDISSMTEAAMQSSGFQVNTTDFRHVTALAGTFFFAVKSDEKLYLAQLTLKDSSQPALHCRH